MKKTLKERVKAYIKLGNPIIFALLAGASTARMFNFIDHGYWQLSDLLFTGYLLVFGLSLSIAMQHSLFSEKEKQS